MESDIATNNAKNSYPAGDATKVGFISVTQAVDLDSMETDISNLSANKYDKTGGTISGAVTITGDLTVNGTTTTVNTQTLSVKDPLIELANDNSANSVDTGFYANYSEDAGVTTKYAGLFKDAGDSDKFKLFKGLEVEPTTTVDTAGTGYTKGDLVVNDLDAVTISGTLSTAAQTNITSVGTLSSLAVSGNLTVDTNTLFVDAANNWVGIGTSSPSRPIHILAPTPGIKLEDTTGNDFGEIVSVDGDLFLRADEGATQADSSIRFQIDQSEKVRITSGGNVGIDSSNPSEKLDINGNIILKSGYKLYGNANAGSTSSYVSLYNAVDGGIDLMANFASSKITFGTAGTEAMRILSNGRVGIGTNSPAELLEVEGNIRGRSFYVDSGATGKGYDFAVSGSGAGTANMFCPSGFTIGFGTNSIERMRISSSGNVGIGTSSPAYPLQVSVADGNRVRFTGASSDLDFFPTISGVTIISTGQNFEIKAFSSDLIFGT